MTDIVADLRDRAEHNRRYGEAPGNDQAHYRAMAQAYSKAADLLEVDPLYRAAPKLLPLLREVDKGFPINSANFNLSARTILHDILAMLPEESPK